ESAAGVEQHVALHAVRVGVVAHLGHLRLARKRGGVERLDVLEVHGELEPLEIDSAVGDRIEHEAIVRAGGEAKPEFHRHLRMLDAARPRFSIASPRFHASRLRRSTMFETARTCANGTPLIRHAYMNAAPSMLSTCGANRCVTEAIDRWLP